MLIHNAKKPFVHLQTCLTVTPGPRICSVQLPEVMSNIWYGSSRIRKLVQLSRNRNKKMFDRVSRSSKEQLLVITSFV